MNVTTMSTHSWPHLSKKRKRSAKSEDDDDSPQVLPLIIPKSMGGAQSTIYSQLNHVYFNDDITSETAFALCKELRTVETQLKLTSTMLNLDTPQPIVLHITTDGGCIHSAFTVVDVIQRLSLPVHTVVEGFVASAGTLIALAGEKRCIGKNAYMLIHELRSGVWGKMSSIEEECANLRKVMDHIIKFYMDTTPFTKKQLEKLLTHDIVWNAEECIEKGLVGSVYV